jgi:hypothetical protein
LTASLIALLAETLGLLRSGARRMIRMSAANRYPRIEIRLCSDQVDCWQLELAQHLHGCWPGGVQILLDPKAQHISRPLLARYVRALERVSIAASGLHVASESSRVPPGIVLDLTGGAQGRMSMVPTGCTALILRSLGGDLAAQNLPFAAETVFGAPTASVHLDFVAGHSGAEGGFVELGCWRILPERYLATTSSILQALPRALERVLRSIDWQVPTRGLKTDVSRDQRRSVQYASRVLSFRLLGCMARGLGHRLWQDLFRHEQWTIGIAAAPISAFLREGTLPSIRWLPPRSGREYVADPFGISLPAGFLVYAERFDYLRGKGAIVTLRFSTPDSQPVECRSLELRSHLSYPFLLRDGGRLLGIPENFQSNSISMYDLDQDDPSAWRNCRVLVERFAGVDATVFQWDLRWWLFATDHDSGPDSHLHIWHADTPDGPWIPHLYNPVKIDARSARPGGTPFVADGRLFRPAQDCSRTYGGRVVINEIITLGPDSFEENVVAFVEPEEGSAWPDGLHTLSACGENITLLDAKRVVFSPAAAWGVARNVLRKRMAKFRGIKASAATGSQS